MAANAQDLITSGLDFLQGIDVIGSDTWQDVSSRLRKQPVSSVADFDGGNVENLVTGLSKPT